MYFKTLGFKITITIITAIVVRLFLCDYVILCVLARPCLYVRGIVILMDQNLGILVVYVHPHKHSDEY